MRQTSDPLTLDLAVLPDGTQVTLPHHWTHEPGGMGGSVRYRVAFERPATGETLQAVYLPRVIMAARVSLNGVAIGESGFSGKEVGRYFHTPLLYTFPPTLYAPGNNVLEIEVRAYANRHGRLGQVQVGTESILRTQFDQDYFATNTSQIIGAALALLYVTLLTPVWWIRRESAIGWFVAGSLAWSINGLNFILREAPVPTPLWEWLVHVSVGLVPLCYGLFVFRHIGERYPRLELTIGALALTFIILTSTLMGHASFFDAVSLWQGLMLLFGAFALIRLLLSQRRRHDPALWYVGSALLLIWVLALHDLFSQAVLQGQEEFWLNFASPLLMLSMGGLMVRRFLNAVDTAEKLNATLEGRVQDAQQALAASYQELQTLETERAVQHERERIYKDLHDDVGAKLLGLTLSAQRANQPREADLARSALQDLRDVVSRSARPASPLADLLADHQAEIRQRITTAGLTLEWEVTEQIPSQQVLPNAALQLGRILRETVSNILHHAHAKHVHVAVQCSTDALTIEICDDGDGNALDFTAGRGMNGMLARAAVLGGTLHWGAARPCGCRVLLFAPLPLAVPDASS